VCSAVKTILLILFSQLLCAAFAFSQLESLVFRKISTPQGLASNSVTGIIQDNKGFIWIATTNGLQKFDGYAFTTYHHDPYNPQSISSDNIGFLLKDRDDNIWMSTAFFGFNHFNPSTGKSLRISDTDDSSYRDMDYSISACLDAEGNTWILSINSVAKYDFARKKLVFFDQLFSKDLSMGMTKSILYDPHTGNLWMNSFLRGLCMLDPKRSLLYHRANNPENLPRHPAASPW